MIESSTLFDEKLKEDARSFLARFCVNGTEVSGDVVTITVNKGSCGSSDFALGTIYCPYIEAMLDGCNEELEGKELLLQFGILSNGDFFNPEYEFIDIGFFTVGDPEVGRYRYSFTAYGRLATRFNGTYTSGDAFPRTIGDVISDLQAQTGMSITVADIDTNGLITKDLVGIRHIEVLSSICEVLGAYATEDSRGGVVIARYSNIGEYPIDGSRHVEEPTFADNPYVLNGITCRGDTDFVYGTGKYEYSSKYMTQELFDAMTAVIGGYSYNPGTIHISMGDPRLEPWDTILYTDSTGRQLYVPCMSITHSFDGGLATDVSAPTGSNEDAGGKFFRGMITREIIEQMQARMDSGEFKGEDATVLRIDSSRGTVFKNNAVSTVLSVTIFHGSYQIKDKDMLAEVFGPGAYLEWSWQRLDDDRFGIISSDDSRLSDGGFKLTLSPSDVDVKVTFQCKFIV